MSHTPHASTLLMRWLGFFGWFPSALLHRLGCLFVGSPSALQLPSNFWVSQPDRLAKEPHMPDASIDDIRAARLRVNHFRVLLTPRVAVLAFALSMTVCLATQVTLLGASGLAHEWHRLTASSSTTNAVRSLDAQTAKACAMARRQGPQNSGVDPGTFYRALVEKCGDRPSSDESAAATQLSSGAF